MPACQSPNATVPDADVESTASFLGYLYIVGQYTVRLMTPCIRRILCLRNSSSVTYFRQPPNLSTAARRNRKCTECGMIAFGRNRMSAESAHLSTFGAETEAEIRSTSNLNPSSLTQKVLLSMQFRKNQSNNFQGIVFQCSGLIYAWID